jgi:hypothetical protein
MDPKAGPLIAEEMGYADAGLHISMGVAGMPMGFAAMSPDPEMQQLVRDYCEDTGGGNYRMLGDYRTGSRVRLDHEHGSGI